MKAFADHVIAERGVRHGHIAYMPADVGAHDHDHRHDHDHSHAPTRRKKP